MQQYSENSLSEEDLQLIETYQLGRFQAGYRVKPAIIRLLHIFRWIFVLLGIFVLVAVILNIWLSQSQQDTSNSILLLEVLLFPLPGSLFALWMGLFFMRTLISAVQSMHIIIGEQGLLKIRKEKGALHPEVLYWQDMVIIPMRIPRRRYCLFSRAKEKHRTYLTLNNSYQKLDELIVLIQRLSNTEKIRTHT